MKGIVRFLIRMFVLNLVLVPIMVLGPLLYVLPFFCIVAHPQDNFSGLAQLYFWLGPLSCAFWMLVSCHWPTVHRARLEGRLSTWREAEGGIVWTVTKATVYMFGGLFASYVFEVLFVLAFAYVPYSVASGVARETLRFAIFPFATYAPVILLWLWRWRRGRKDQLRAALSYTRNLRNNQTPVNTA